MKTESEETELVEGGAGAAKAAEMKEKICEFSRLKNDI